MRWRLLDSGTLSGPENMAVDCGLLDRARESGESVLRIYQWSTPTLSFGRHESVRARFSAATLEAAAVGVVRRPTGGRVLMHDHEVTYSVTAPVRDDEPLREGYRRINQVLIDALARLGVTAIESPPSTPMRPGGAACFAEPNEGEIVIGHRKIIGSAQIREHGAMLQHGSILIDDDQPRISTLATGPITPSAPAATLTSAMGRTPSYDEVRDALAAALVATVGSATPLDAADVNALAAPHRARFESPEWTWRR